VIDVRKDRSVYLIQTFIVTEPELEQTRMSNRLDGTVTRHFTVLSQIPQSSLLCLHYIGSLLYSLHI